MYPNLILLLGRILTTPIMLVYGLQKLVETNAFINNPATMNMLATLGYGAPAPIWLAYLNGFFQFASSLFVLFGYKAKLASYAIVLWLMPVTYFGHPFWSGVNAAFNEAQFYKNLAIISAFLFIGLHGAGRYSVDSFFASRRLVTRSALSNDR